MTLHRAYRQREYLETPLMNKLNLTAKYGNLLYLSVRPSIIKVPLTAFDNISRTLVFSTEYTSIRAFNETVVVDDNLIEYSFYKMQQILPA